MKLIDLYNFADKYDIDIKYLNFKSINSYCIEIEGKHTILLNSNIDNIHQEMLILRKNPLLVVTIKYNLIVANLRHILI